MKKFLALAIVASLITLGCGGVSTGWVGRGGCKSYQQNERAWIGCDFSMQDLTSTTFSPNRGDEFGDWLQHSSFLYAEMAGVNLEGFQLSFDDFSQADLTGANLKSVVVKHSDLENAKLIGANLEGASFYFSSANGADFSGANLAGAQFKGTSLRSASFAGANLREASFGNGGYIDGVDFTDADLTGASFGVMFNSSFIVKSPIYCRTTMPDGSMNNENCGGN
jgi:uncharacterized protein YjbI with pentapeptide repeats